MQELRGATVLWRNNICASCSDVRGDITARNRYAYTRTALRVRAILAAILVGHVVTWLYIMTTGTPRPTDIIFS